MSEDLDVIHLDVLNKACHHSLQKWRIVDNVDIELTMSTSKYNAFTAAQSDSSFPPGHNFDCMHHS